MPLPRALAVANRVGLNRVTRHLAPHAPWLGLVVHVGRTSGRTYRTPVNVFATGTGLRIALTYGPECDWVRNVLAAGGCRIRHRGRTWEMVEPVVRHDPQRAHIGGLSSAVLGLAGANDFLDLTYA